MSTHIHNIFSLLCFAQFKPSVFVYYQQSAFQAAFCCSCALIIGLLFYFLFYGVLTAFLARLIVW